MRKRFRSSALGGAVERGVAVAGGSAGRGRDGRRGQRTVSSRQRGGGKGRTVRHCPKLFVFRATASLPGGFWDTPAARGCAGRRGHRAWPPRPATSGLGDPPQGDGEWESRPRAQPRTRPARAGGWVLPLSDMRFPVVVSRAVPRGRARVWPAGTRGSDAAPKSCSLSRKRPVASAQDPWPRARQPRPAASRPRVRAPGRAGRAARHSISGTLLRGIGGAPPAGPVLLLPPGPPGRCPGHSCSSRPCG